MRDALPRDKISKARAGLVLDFPFFGSLALRLMVREDPSCETAWTNGITLGYNPDFIGSLTMDETKGILCHEIMHLACAHQARRNGRDMGNWNRATDYAVNQILEDSKVCLPNSRLLDPAFHGMSADEIYNRLPSSPPDGGGNSGDGRGGSDPGGCGEVRDVPGEDGGQASQAELTQAEEDWKIAVAQAAQQAKSMGSLPAGIPRLIDEILMPKVDWKEVLRRFVDQAARNDYRWFPPNRRYLSHGFYLPSLRSECLPPIVIAVDTSGSIGQAEIDQFATEVTAILQDYRTSCTVLYCDTKIAHIEEFTSEDLPLKLSPKGGGGTSFVPPYQWVEERALQPACLIYLTDMCGTFPDNAPGYPVMWAHIGPWETTPPFGEVIRL